MKARVLDPSPENIAKVAEALRTGEVAGMPTETVYGLAGDVFNPCALGRIYEAKERPTFDPLIAHVAAPEGRTASIAWLSELGLVDAGKLTAHAAQAEILMNAFWPGPLTLVLPRRAQVPELATSGLPTIAVRMPAHPVAQALIRASGTVLAAPSANRFGRISPTTAAAVLEELGDRIPWILDGGSCSVGVESTIVAVSQDGWKLLRPGGTPVEAIETLLGSLLVRPDALAPIEAPGMIESHYAPTRTLELLPKPLAELSDGELKRLFKDRKLPSELGLLLIGGDPAQGAKRLEAATGAHIEARSLSRAGDLTEAASALFSTLRALDRGKASLLLAEPCSSDRGLGYAISDRLKRASSPRDREG